MSYLGPRVGPALLCAGEGGRTVRETLIGSVRPHAAVDNRLDTGLQLSSHVSTPDYSCDGSLRALRHSDRADTIRNTKVPGDS